MYIKGIFIGFNINMSNEGYYSLFKEIQFRLNNTFPRLYYKFRLEIHGAKFKYF